MRQVLTGKEMKARDEATSEHYGVPSLCLMERAALSVVRHVELFFGEGFLSEKMFAPEILVVCGSGNNGGDGFAVARLLLIKGYRVRVFFAGREASMTEQCALQRKIYLNYGGVMDPVLNPSGADLVLDALFGVGLTREIQGNYRNVIEEIVNSGRPVLALDLPSGISADTGEVMGVAIRAQKSVTFGFLKRGLLLFPGRDYAGEVVLEDVGITDLQEGKPAFTWEKSDLKRLPFRPARSNKGTFGRILIVGGQCGMAGAVMMAAKAAGRTGCGLMEVCTDRENRIVLQTGLPEAVFTDWDNEPARKEKIRHADVVGIGPGLGQSEKARELLQEMLAERTGPLVIDADGLNILSKDLTQLAGTKAWIVLTPHPGEMSRLCQKTVPEILKDPVKTAMGLTHRLKTVIGTENPEVICVLKDACTVVTDGENLYLNESGCNGMACGGSGDVLTGVLCAMLATKLPVFEAVTLGVYVHGLAGEAAADKWGNRGMLACELIDALAEVTR